MKARDCLLSGEVVGMYSWSPRRQPRLRANPPSPHHRLHPLQRPRHGSGEGREGAPEAPLGTAGLALELVILPQPHRPPQGVFCRAAAQGGTAAKALVPGGGGTPPSLTSSDA